MELLFVGCLVEVEEHWRACPDCRHIICFGVINHILNCINAVLQCFVLLVQQLVWYGQQMKHAAAHACYLNSEGELMVHGPQFHTSSPTQKE